MYCLKCGRVTVTENITTARSKNGRLMKRGQYITCGKLRLNSSKNNATGGSFLITTINNLPFELHLPGHNFTCPGTTVYKIYNLDGTPKE